MMRVAGQIAVICCFLLMAGSGGIAAGIHDAASAGDTNSVLSAVAGDASLVNRKDKDGRTILHIAMKSKNTEMVKLILSKGADTMIMDRDGKTALRAAVDAGFEEGLRALITMSSAGYIDPLIDIRRKEGLDALQDGTLAKASEMLGRLVRNDPASEDINFAYGLSWLSLGDPAPAGAAFERALVINPSNSRARIELARARVAAKRYAEAGKELEMVLDEGLPPDVHQTVAACLKEVRSSMTRWYTSGSMELGGLYDDNANVGPASSVIRIAPLTMFGSRITELTLSESSRPEDASGAYIVAGARAFYDTGAIGAWFLTADMNAYMNLLSESEYEAGSLQAGVGLRRIVERGYLQMPVRARYIEYGGEQLVSSYGVYPSLVYAPSSMDNVYLTTTLSFERREFDVLTDRNSYYMNIGEMVHKSFARGLYNVYGGLEIQHDDTDSAEYEFTGAGCFAGGDVRLPLGINLFGEMRFAYRDYDEKNILAPEDRVDNQYQFAAGVSRDFNRRWSVMLAHSVIRNDSSFDLYEYERQMSTFSTRLKF